MAVGLFLLLIAIHEFGHFIAAKAVGIRVNEFAIGFGPCLFSKQIGETNYALKLIPFGGYCAMEGEDSDSADTRAFCNKKPWRRLIVVVMGAVFNLLLGLVIVACILAPEKSFRSTVVAEFYEDAVSSKSGLMAGDKIIEVDGRRIYTTYDLGYSFTNVKDGKVDMTVRRGGEKVKLKDVEFKSTTEDGITFLSVDFYVRPVKKTVGSFVRETVNTSISYCAVIWRSLIDLISGKYGISAVSGPVGVTAAIGTAAKQSLRSILPIMALITINLGLFNLLPIPALDGGRVVFLLIEMIFRKPVPKRYEAWVHAAGFIALISFMVLITAKDLWSLFAG